MRYNKLENTSEQASFVTSKHGKFRNDKIALKSLATLSSVQNGLSKKEKILIVTMKLLTDNRVDLKISKGVNYLNNTNSKSKAFLLY